MRSSAQNELKKNLKYKEKFLLYMLVGICCGAFSLLTLTSVLWFTITCLSISTVLCSIAYYNYTKIDPSYRYKNYKFSKESTHKYIDSLFIKK